jgi:hypothetical protein
MENEWIFAINDFEDSSIGFVVTINSREFWEQEACLSDETPDEIRDQMYLSGFAELIENTWEPMRNMTREEAIELMEMNGFIHDARMEKWLNNFKE